MIQRMLPYVLAFVPIAIVGVANLGPGPGPAPGVVDPATTLLIVRHAERTDDSANSNLSPAGVVQTSRPSGNCR